MRFIAGRAAELFVPESFMFSPVKIIFRVHTKPVYFTFRSVLIFFDTIDVLLHVSELFHHCLQHTFNLPVRGFIEVHVVTFLCLHETGLVHTSAYLTRCWFS